MTAPRSVSAIDPEAGRHVDPLWLNAPCPVLVTDRHGCLAHVNDAARLILPDAARGARFTEHVPEWLAEAHLQVRDAAGAGPAADTPHGTVGDRHFSAHATRAADGGVVWWLMDDTDRRLAEEALGEAQRRSEVLSAASSMLLSTLNVSRCTELAASMAAEHLAEAAVLIAPPQGRRHPLTYASRGGAPVHTTKQVDIAGVPGLREALQGFPPVPARWIDPAGIPAWAIPDGFAGPAGSVIVAPLPGHGVPAGALILLRSSTEQAFTEGEEVFARLFAARAGAALSAARLYTEQATITTALMQDLLPPALHTVHGVDYAGSYRTSADHERIGGDFYDVHPGTGPSEETLAVLGDVAGKGLEAAVLTGKIRNTLHALLPLAEDHERILNLLNRALLNSHHTRFATLALVSVRRRGGRAQLRLTSAGHLPPLIVRGDGTVEEVDTRGTLVGALPAVTARTVTRVLAPGDTCLLYTDGITEARGGPTGEELFGESRLHRALAECAGMPAEAVVERVQMLAAQWLNSGRHDDMAVMAITAPRTGALSIVDGGPTRRNRP
ncbi:SpoIIE family protein phosphatase [Streptomyces sp. NPDC001046]|uniref:SpoIIE family protein phosphatase n=1 Tax=Streptomyces sp. NPDC001046 TaxID=3364543 RepID=UPI00368AFA71